jgi:hypothetical protein
VGAGLAEQDEDRRAAGVGGRGLEVVGEQLGAVDVEERVEQRSQPGGRGLRIERAHDSTLPGPRRRARVGATMERRGRRRHAVTVLPLVALRPVDP